MKYFFLVFGLLLPVISVQAQDVMGPLGQSGAFKPAFTWDLLFSGSWEESKNLLNRGDLRLGLGLSGQTSQPWLLVRGQALDRHTLNFELDPSQGNAPWGDPSKTITSASLGLYHRATGSRLLYGVLDEWGLPARIRNPWIRSAPYTENHQPVMADLRTTVSSTKTEEAYLYVSSPRMSFFEESGLPIMIRGFASGQFAAADVGEGNLAPAFSGGLESILGKKTELRLEGFYTGAELPARTGNSWFSDPAPLPARDFRLTAAALMLNMPYWSLASDWAWSETFAWGGGFYGNGGIRLNPLLPWTDGKPGPWSLSLAADGMSERYVGRDGSNPGGGLRTAGKIEWKGPRNSLFRVNTTLRGPALDEPFNRSGSGIYYRFPAASAAARSGGLAGSSDFPLRATRISLNADRNASNPEKISDGIDAALGLSLNMPPLSLPRALLPASARKVKNIKPKSYPLGINLSTSINELGHAGKTYAAAADETIPPYPFFPTNAAMPFEFDSAKTSGELLWSPGIFQFRTRWGYTAYAKKDNQWDGSISTAVRFKHSRLTQMRFGAKFAWPEFPEKWNCTLSWRVEK